MRGYNPDCTFFEGTPSHTFAVAIYEYVCVPRTESRPHRLIIKRLKSGSVLVGIDLEGSAREVRRAELDQG